MHRSALAVMALVASITLAACGQPAPTYAMLFEAAGFVPVADEASLLSSQERESLRLRREDRFVKRLMVVSFNPEALRSPTISLEMPDHRVYSFNGVVAPAMGVPGYTWRASSTADVAVAQAAASTATASDNSSSLAKSLELYFDGGRKHVVGQLVVANRSFQLTSLNGRYLALAENGLNPSSPPIDAEPFAPTPSRQPNAEWPRGLLTERLRESLATSSIGAQLPPEHCKEVATCGEVTMISCQSTRDGPAMYFNNVSGRLIMACGGACMRGPGLPDSKLCTACPPPEWKACDRAGG